MPHALLLSPDDQAVSAITGVLEEMSVTCERPLDGVSAAHKLNSQIFDLVLVDCENLPAAKLIFDVCRRGKNGNHPVPIAIVDGRAGLPTAFRLGAELILTKPVAKDQARSTIRAAVSRVRKDVQPSDTTPSQPAAGVTAETHAHAATASASPQLTSYADPVGNFDASTTNTAASDLANGITSDITINVTTDVMTSDVMTSHAPTDVMAGADTGTNTGITNTGMMSAAALGAETDRFSAAFSAPNVTTRMQSSVEEVDTTQHAPALNPEPASFQSPSVSESTPDQASPVSWRSAREVKPSDDPVLAELERTEVQASDLAESKSKDSVLKKTDLEAPAIEPLAPLFPSSRQGRQKSRAPLVLLLMVVFACAAFYVAWMYEPGFRAAVQPQVDRLLAIAGMAPHNQTQNASPEDPIPAPATPSTTISATTPELATDPNKPAASDSAPGSAATSSAAPAAATPAATITPAPSGPAAPSPSLAAKPEDSKPSDNRNKDNKDGKNDTVAAASSAVQLPGEDSAIILSSKGAEKRLDHSVPPKFPVDARSAHAQGTVVLKAVIDESGKVEGVRLVEGDATLAPAAIEAVKQWHYRPYVRDGKPQPFQTVVIVDFQRP